jgi:hypothetical protein
MKRRIETFIIVAVVAVISIVIQCGVNSANTSEVGNPGLTGYVVDGRTGKTVQGARLRLYKTYSSAMGKALGKVASGKPAFDSTDSDMNGHYQFEELPDGEYSLQGELIDGGDTLSMMHSAIYFSYRNFLGYDTLNLSGSIKGCIFNPTESVNGVTCYVPGTSYQAICDSLGNFIISGLPPKTYSLSFLSNRFTDTIIQNIVVQSNLTNDIGYVPLRLDASRNEHDVWGTVGGDSKTVAKIEAFITGDGIPVGKPKSYLLDWRPDVRGFSGFIFLPSDGFFWKIQVVVYDSAARKIGESDQITVTRATGDIEIPSLTLCNSSPYLLLDDTTVSIKDTIRLAPLIDKADKDSIVAMAWKIGKQGAFVVRSKPDTVIIAPNDSGELACYFRVIDKFGNVSVDSNLVTVVKDAPSLDIGNDTVVAAGSSCTIYARTQQQFGSIAVYKWDFNGDGVWDESGWGDSTVRHAFYLKGKNIVRCCVQDDDGNQVYDSLTVFVGTLLKGEQSVDSTLSMMNSPYFVKNSYIVLAGAVLRIQPGVKIWFAPDAQLKNEGSLEAIGEKGNRIIFAASDTNRGWAGINTSGSSTSLKCCNILNAGVGVGDGPSGQIIDIDSCYISNAGYGIYGSGNSVISLTITNSHFNQCMYGGIYVQNWGSSQLMIQNNSIEFALMASGYGISLNGNGSAVIRNNTISGYWMGMSGQLSDGITVVKNVFTKNRIGVSCTSNNLDSNNIFSNSNFNAAAPDNQDWNVSNNWWGTIDTADIHDMIKDRKDDPNLGHTIITPILMEPVPDAGWKPVDLQ